MPLFCSVVLVALSSFAIILLMKRGLDALLVLIFHCREGTCVPLLVPSGWSAHTQLFFKSL